MRTRGERVIAFIETYCITPEGDLIGRPMKLEEFQRRFILDIYDNPFGTQKAFLSIARKNGKTSLIAALLLAHLAGPEATKNSQIVSGAQSKEQASIIFELACKMIQTEQVVDGVPVPNPLERLIRIHPSGKRLTGLARNVLYRALAAEGKTTYGLSPILAILDEIGQVEGPTDKFVGAITSAQGAYQHPLLIAISTQAPTDHDLFSVWLDRHKAAPDPRAVCHVYAAPDDCELDDRSAWAAANPALGVFRSIDDIASQATDAELMPANEPDFRNLILNQRVEKASPFVSRSVWDSNNAEAGTLDGKKVWGGLDLAEVNDLCALVLVDDAGGVHPTFWLPEVGLRQKSQKDHVPYDIWQAQGKLQTTPGKAVQYEFIAEYLRGVFDRCDVQLIGFDRYHMKFLKPWLEKAGFSDVELAKFVEFGQGTASMTPALRELEVRLLTKQLKHGGHPVLNMCAANVVVTGNSGARKFDKEKARGRIDGMVALAMGVGVMPQIVDQPEYQMMVL